MVGSKYSHFTLINVNHFHETSMSDFLLNELNFNICIAFYCTAHNFTSFIQKVMKCIKKQWTLIRLHICYQNGWLMWLNMQTLLMCSHVGSRQLTEEEQSLRCIYKLCVSVLNHLLVGDDCMDKELRCRNFFDSQWVEENCRIISGCYRN
jgi:hypothetical protein